MRRAHDHSVWSVQAEDANAEAEADEPSTASRTPGAAANTDLAVVENPMAAATFTVGERSNSSGELLRTYSPRMRTGLDEHGASICPDHLRSIDALLTASNGQPTNLFWFSQACCAIQCPHILYGTFCSPGVMVAAEKHDKLMGLAIFCVAVGLGGTAMIIEDVRRAVRTNGPLTKLGAGSRVIPSSRCAHVAKVVKKFHPDHAAFKAKIVVVAVALGAVAIFDAGIHHTAHNRVSALLWFLFYVFGNTWIAVWIISMKMATVLSGHAVRAVITTVDEMQDMTEWSTKVCAPALDLASDTMAHLSIGWGRSVVVYSGCAMLGIIAAFSIGLSPVALAAVDTALYPTVLRAGCGAAVLVLTALPLLVASGPAHVSSMCEELLEALNELRIAMMTPTADSQISVLEKGLKNLNRYVTRLDFCTTTRIALQR